MRYFVKAPVSGWHEVDNERFNAFIENIRKHATGLRSSEKDDYIARVTLIAPDDSTLTVATLNKSIR